MEAPKLKAYLVTTQWTNCGSLDIFVASSSEMAAACATMCAMRAEPAPEGNLTNLLVREVPEAALRTLLVQIETGRPAASVVQLVQPAEPDLPDALDPVAEWRRRHGVPDLTTTDYLRQQAIEMHDRQPPDGPDAA